MNVSRHRRVALWVLGLSPLVVAIACSGTDAPIEPVVDAGTDAAADAADVVADVHVADATPVDSSADAADAGAAGEDAEVPLIPAPTDVSAIAGDGLAIVSWEWSVLGAVTYTVRSVPTGFVVETTSKSTVVTGLTNGTSYTFRVVATNRLGSSLPSAPSNAVVPAVIPGAPGAPSAVTATGGDGKATVSWTAPDDHGSPVTSYTVSSIPGGITATTPDASVEVTGLTNGESYTFFVVATNAAGIGAASFPSNAVVPAGAPSPPVNVSAARGDGSARVTWTAPNDNGSPITSYTVTADPGGATVTSTTTSVDFGGLVNGTAYRFTVTATNAVGTSAPSTPSSYVIPAGLPGVPTGVHATPRNASAWVYWTAPNDNGSPIVRYTVTSSPGGVTVNTSDTGARVLGLVNGTSYTFTVTATNGVGVSAPSDASAPVVPTAVGCAETEYTVTAPSLAYVFNGVGNNPPITVCRGQTFTFHLSNVPAMHPFFIKNADGTPASGVTNNGATGTVDVVWAVPVDQPSGAYYQCSLHPTMMNGFEIQ